MTTGEKLVADLPVPPRFYNYSGRENGSGSERIFFDLGKERSDRLRALTQEADIRSWTQDISLFHIFATILFAFLSRVSAQQKLAIGAPAHNRLNADFKRTPGVFIEIFPILVEIQEEDSLGSLFQKVRNEAFTFLKYAQPGAGSPELNRGFNVVLNYINASFADFAGIPMRSEWVHPDHCDPGHHLRLHVHDFDATGSIQLLFDLNHDVFGPALRKRVPEHFLHLLDAFIEDRSQAIGQAGLLTAADKETTIVRLNATDNDFTEQKTVVDLFEAQVRQNPEAVAIRSGEQSWTYQSINAKANQLARYLREQGLERGGRVALYSKRSPEFLIAVWAVLKAGGTYIPIAADYPEERVKTILEDAQVFLLLSTNALVSKLQIPTVASLCLDTDWPLIEKQDGQNLEIVLSANHLAYIMYTSGSTGTPKGVMISHWSLSHYIQSASRKYEVDSQTGIPLFSSLAFDLTVTSQFLAFVNGGTLQVYEEVNEGPDLAVLQVIEDNQVDLIKLTPSHLALLRDQDLSASRIRTMIVGGENLTFELARSISKAFEDRIAIYNEYGPTEATVGCVVYRFDPQLPVQNSVPIGRPIDNTQVYVLDPYLNPVPQGLAGELYIAGVGLAEGYWKQTGLSAERFVPNPFSEGERMYRSGDLVYLDPNGELEYLGRIDQQLKIRGKRIELGEIESTLVRHPGVQSCVVEMMQRKRYAEETHNCTECGLPSNYPGATFDEAGVCHLCRSFESYEQKAKQYFKTPEELQALFDRIKEKPNRGDYDCILLLSGGKDSTYALARLAEMGLKVLAFTLDNGYISEQAKANIRRVVKGLGVDHVFGETPAMNAIFVDSLHRHHNVCDGCFKTIYTLSIQIALEKNIPYIVTGLSRGQFFETRLTEELFWKEEVDIASIDQTILDARKAYHRVDDAVKHLLDVSMFEDDEVFEKVQFLDFYRYCDVSLEEMLDYLDQCLPWVRPTDTGRSTNCLINQAGIYIHKKEKGYSNYAFPYSWDVRIGHKTREASLEEINEAIDEKEVQRILEEIGYTQAQEESTTEKHLVGYYTGPEEIADVELYNHLALSLADYMIPVQFIRLEAMPLTSNGKVDREALPQPDAIRPVLSNEYQAPRNDIEEMLAGTWSEVLRIDRVGVYDKFIHLGGNSLSAIRLIARINEAFDLDLPINLVFSKPTVASFAAHIETTIVALLEQLDNSEIEP